MHWMWFIAFLLIAAAVLLLVGEIVGKLTAPYKKDLLHSPIFVRITAGPHAGREGNVVSFPWVGNLWHRRLVINVPATEEEIRQVYGAGYGDRIGELIAEMEQGRGPRHWVRVWHWQVAEPAPAGQ